MGTKRTTWTELTAEPLGERGRAAYDDEARISEFREFVFRLRTEAGLTQGELASRMGTTQSAIARMEGGGTRPTLDTLEKLASLPPAWVSDDQPAPAITAGNSSQMTDGASAIRAIE